jgi:hypothetical protein
MYKIEDVKKYRLTRGKKKLILDTNLLFLFLVGACDESFLPKCECTQKYTVNDYKLLLEIFRYFESDIVITPHILAEFSNISIRDIKEPKIHYYLQTVLNRLKSYKEEQVSLERLIRVKVNILALYGFTDMSIIEGAKKINAVILTDDMGLGLYADTCKIPSIKFGALRSYELMKKQ